MTTNADALPVLIAAGRCGWTEIVRYIIDSVPPEHLQKARDDIESMFGLPARSQECLAIIQAAIDWETLNSGPLDDRLISSITSITGTTKVPPRRIL